MTEPDSRRGRTIIEPDPLIGARAASDRRGLEYTRGPLVLPASDGAAPGESVLGAWARGAWVLGA